MQCTLLWQWWCWWRWWDYFRVTLCILPLCLAPCSALRFSTKPHFANIYLLTLHILPKWDGRRIQTWDRTPRNRVTETSTQKEDKTKIIKIFAGLLYFCHWPWSSELKTLTWFLAWLPPPLMEWSNSGSFFLKKKTDGRKSNVAQGGWDEFENEWNEVDAVKAISPVRPSLRFTTRFYDFRPGESHASIRKPNQP